MSAMYDDGGMDDGSGAAVGYAWEQGFERTWEGVEEDEQGHLKTISEAEQQLSRARRHKLAIGQTIKRGIIRYLYLAVDLSKTMADGDMRPSRLAVTLRVAADFIANYFDQNPLSQLGIIATRNGTAEKVTDLSGNPKAHVDALKRRMHTEGDASLQNLLEMAIGSLRAVPEYGNREVVVLYSSLSTCDPGDIHETINKLKQHTIRASVVGIGGAEMYICKKVAEETHGDYGVALDEGHYKDLLMAQTVPPPTLAKKGPQFADLVRMGFPDRRDLYPSLGFSGRQQTLTVTGYFCPGCNTKTTELPSTCQVCNLPLISSPHLARSYHHLFPVPTFDELKEGPDKEAAQTCHGCVKPLQKATAIYRCPKCRHAFCLDCDMYVHDSLHNCPGCC